MKRVYVDGFHVETVFTDDEQTDAMNYWQRYGEVTIKNHPGLIRLIPKGDLNETRRS